MISLTTTCCVAGGGPVGMMLGFLLAAPAAHQRNELRLGLGVRPEHVRVPAAA